MDDQELVKRVYENPYKIKLVSHTKGPPTVEISVSGTDKVKTYDEMKELFTKFMQDFGR